MGEPERSPDSSLPHGEEEMKIQIYENISGAKEARGLTVIIDVFRAFSLEPYLIDRGAERILAVGAEETARRLKAEHPEYVLVGERKGIKLPGFDYGNSPTQTAEAQLKGKTVVHTTSAGTQGIVNAVHAEEILVASLVTARATAEYILAAAPETVSLVAMGLHGIYSAPEDTLCARYLRSLLTKEPMDMAHELEVLRHTESSERFFRPENRDVFPQGDYGYCTAVDRFGFALRVSKEEEDIFRVQPVCRD